MRIAPILVTLLSLGSLVVSGDRDFTPQNKTESKKDGPIKTSGKFAKGVMLDICLAGNCSNGQLVHLGFNRVEEFDTSNRRAQAGLINASTSDWTTFEEMEINGAMASTSSYITPLKTNSTDASLNFTIAIFHKNTTTQFGNETIVVPTGALKFTVTISNWPFKNNANHLKFGVHLHSRRKNNTEGPRPEKRKKNGTNVDRVDLSEGMFMDAPTFAVLDGVQTAINSTINIDGDKAEYVWEFPSFSQKLYYDPVVGSSDVSTQTSDSTVTITTTTPSTSTTTPTPSDVVSWKIVSSTTACLAMIAMTLL